MHLKLTTLAVVATLFCCNSIHSATSSWTWTGAQGSGDWNDKLNWSTTDNDATIGSSDTVIINDGNAAYPSLDANQTVRMFILNGGYMFANGYNLTVNDDIFMYGGEFNAYLSGIIADNVYMYGGGFGVSSGLNISGQILVDGGYFIPFSSGVVINDDLIFLSGTVDLNNQDITIKGEFDYQGGSLINAGKISTGNMVIDIPGEYTLVNDLTVSGSVEFINGIINSSNAAMMIFDSEATVTGASINSYVNGPVRRLVSASGNSDFVFPTGNDSVYAPIGISDFAQARNEDFFTAQYFMSSAPYNHNSKDITLDHLSGAEYWILDRGASSGTPDTDVKVRLFFDETMRSGQVDVASQLRAAKWDGSTWKDLGTSSPTGNNTIGSFKSSSVVTSFSPFTIGSNTGGNPLPIALLDFKAMAFDKEIKVSWSTTSEINNDFFTVQKSLDGKSWSAIGIVDGVENSVQLTNYSFMDKAPVKGVQFYRLIQTDLNGTSTFSHIATVNFNGTLSASIALFPNPVQDVVNLSLNESGSDISILVYNSMGRKVMELNNQSGRTFAINMSEFEKGIYTIEIQHENGVSISKILKN